MKPKRSLPHSQAPETCTYPEPAPSSPYPHISRSEMHLIIIPHLLLVSQLLDFPQVFPPKPCIRLSFPIRATYTTHLILLGFIICTILSEEYRAPHYMVSSTSLIPRPSKAQVFSSTSYSQIPSVCVPPSISAIKIHTHTKHRQNYTSVYHNLYIFG